MELGLPAGVTLLTQKPFWQVASSHSVPPHCGSAMQVCAPVVPVLEDDAPLLEPEDPVSLLLEPEDPVSLLELPELEDADVEDDDDALELLLLDAEDDPELLLYPGVPPELPLEMDALVELLPDALP